MTVPNKIKNMPEYPLADTILDMAEKYKCCMANESNIEKIGLCLFNTFGDHGLDFYKRVFKLYNALLNEKSVEAIFAGLKGTKSRASFASFMYYASEVGIERVDYLITYNGDHMAISCS